MFIKLWNVSAEQWDFTTESNALWLVANNPDHWWTQEVYKLNQKFQQLKNHADPLHGSKRYKRKPL